MQRFTFALESLQHHRKLELLDCHSYVDIEPATFLYLNANNEIIENACEKNSVKQGHPGLLRIESAISCSF